LKHLKRDWRKRDYWDKLATAINDDINLARALPNDAPEFLTKWVSAFEVDVAEFYLENFSGVLLDAGCGNGNLLVHAMRLPSWSKMSYIGIDFSLKMIERTNVRAKEKLNVFFMQANIKNLPLKAHIFDRIVSSGVIACLGTIGETKRTLKEYYRVLKPKGVLIVDIFNRYTMRTLAKSLVIRGSLPKPPEYYGPLWFLKSLKEFGFKVQVCRGYDYRPTSGYLTYRNLLKYLNPFSIQEKYSTFIEKRISSKIPVVNFFGSRIYVKCVK
jgi:ubiquinone/menaquinone biosynthesis C-methylase UbiE